MTAQLVCWKCGAALAELPLPLARLAECPACRAELHVCKLCAFYDTAVAKHCREPVAEEVQDKQRANFCGYFQARPDAWQAGSADAARTAHMQLDALFGGAAPSAAPADDARAALDRLFGGDKPDSQ